jgi:hypothetical protein
MKKLLIAAATGTLLTGVAFPMSAAQAATVTCSSYTGFTNPAFTALREDASTRGISPNSGCEVASFVQDSPANVNAAKFFNINTWTLLAKSDEQSGSSFFTPTEGQSGAFDFSSLLIDFTKYDVLVTFKGPNQIPNETPKEFPIVGYLASQATGSWSSPFTDFNPRGNPRVRDTSHISIFQSAKSPAAVPTPALLPGLVGMGIAALRKRKQEAEKASL